MGRAVSTSWPARQHCCLHLGRCRFRPPIDRIHRARSLESPFTDRDSLAQMKQPAEPLIRNISDTARWVAVYRARETERPDAIFRDPYARALAGERGEQIARAMPFGEQNAWSFIARTWAIDRQ